MHYFSLFLLFLLIQVFSANCCIEHERDALLEFKTGVNDNDNRLASWRGKECCNWTRIRCSNRTGHVVKLNLRNTDVDLFEFNGDIIFYWSYHTLTGKISPSLLHLSDLKHLDLSYNNFSGNKFPNFIAQFRNLRYLNLSHTALSGMIPPQLGNLSKLLYLDLSHDNIFSESILNANTWWLSNLKSLKHIDMSGVDFKGSNDWAETLGKLSLLEVLVLSDNNLTQIPNRPTFVNFTYLKVLHLSYQNFNVPIPNWVGNLTSLNKIELNHNSLQGMVPPLHSLTKLTHLSLPGNNIEGDISELFLGKLSNYTLGNIEYLDISSNNLTGTLTGWISGMTNVTYLSLGDNKLSGTIPIDIGNLTNLAFLDLSNNFLIGLFGSDWTPSFQLNTIWLSSCKLGPKFPTWLQRQAEIENLDLSNTEIDDYIPNWIWSLSSVSILDLSHNLLRGKLPSNLVHMTKLSYMHLSNNWLEGNIPFLPTSLWFLDLSSNRLSGHLPPFWSNISEINLANNRLSGVVPSSMSCSVILMALKLGNNSLTGEFPLDLQFCTGLQLLDLGENNFHGIIPDWVGESLQQLIFLRLKSNLFSGNIPFKLTQLNNLQVLDLANNYFFGSLPRGLDNFRSMSRSLSKGVDLEESLNEMIKGLILDYEDKDLFSLKSLDLLNNNLIGEIPQEIVVLTALMNLNLSQNHLVGNIPLEIGNMTSLESLDLHMNNLSGTIPQSISALYFLAVLNISYNNLFGSIPTGHQLQTLNDPSIYSGNPYLCGPPLETSCDSVRSPQSIGNNKSNLKITDDIDKWLYLFIEFGFVTGFLVVFFVLMFKVKWRYTYFQIVDSVFDRLYVMGTLTFKWLMKEQI